MALVTIQVHGEILDPDGLTPAVGTVSFRSMTELRDTVANITYEPATWTETLDLNGEFTVTLPTTDNPDITPLDWQYRVYVSTGQWREKFFIELPVALGPVAEFADLIPIEADPSDCTPDGTACAPISLVGEVEDLADDLDALEANAVLKDPPLVLGVYVGNVVTPPPVAPNTVSWLSSTPIPHSAADTNPDFMKITALDEFGNQVDTFVLNGNAEPRSRPSRRNRVGMRSFESAEAVGYSTGQYVQWSSNPTNTANREPYLGGFGTAHATKPGWVEATRVVSALLGNSIGGTVNAALAPYDSLSAFIFRGLKTTAGPPTVGTWAVNDVILDSAGVIYRCTVAGTPGTWVGVDAPSAYVNLTPGVNVTLDVNYPAASRLDRGGDNVRLQGTLVAGAIIASGAVIANVTAAHRPSSALRPKTFIVRTTGGGARGRITNTGDLTLNAGLNLNDNVWLDSITYDQL